MNKKYFLCIVLAICLMAFFNHWAIIDSDAYQKAVEFASSNKTLIKQVGSPINVRLSWFGSKIFDRATSGTALLNLVVTGADTNGDVKIYMFKDSTGWMVNSANLDSKSGKIQLNE